MTRTPWTRFVLGLAVLAAPALLIGCAEEAAPTATEPPAAAAPGAPGEAPAAPGAPGEAAPAVEPPK